MRMEWCASLTLSLIHRFAPRSLALQHIKDRALFYVASNDNSVISWFCSKYQHVVAFETTDRTGGDEPDNAGDDSSSNRKGHQIASLIEIMNLGGTDFVVGSKKSSFTRLSRWLGSQNIVMNVLKQQTRMGYVKKPKVSIFTQDYNQCTFRVGDN